MLCAQENGTSNTRAVSNTNSISTRPISNSAVNANSSGASAPITAGFAMPKNANRSNNYQLDDTHRIKIGNKLNYAIAEDSDSAVILFVAEDGKVDVPLLGKVDAVGLTPKQLAENISNLLLVDYYNQVTVHIDFYQNVQSRGQVLVMGQVVNPGLLDVPPGEIMTASRAILYSGGLKEAADAKNVYIIRKDLNKPGEEEKINIDIDSILSGGDFDNDVTLQANDLVFVPVGDSASGTFSVSGAVNAPGVYPMAVGQHLMLSEAILQAGGISQFGNGGSVKIVRNDQEGKRQEINIDVDEILQEGQRDKDIPIKSGDMIIVPERWISF